MDAELTLPLAFMAGLAGAGHCWAMCGGLVGGLFVGRGCAGGGCRPLGPMLRPHLGYHAGRVLAYTLLGALAAGIGQAIVLTGEVGLAQAVLYVVAGLGVVLAGMWTLMRKPAASGCIVQAATPLVHVARPDDPADIVIPGLTRNPVPSRRTWIPAFAGWTDKSCRINRLKFGIAGFLNGLMPCALVFSLTLKAATAPSIVTGASWLFAFGLGTVPAMALAGVLAHWLGAQSLIWLRRAAGVLIIGLGLQAIWAGLKFFQVMLHL